MIGQMARIIRKVCIDSDGRQYVKIGGLNLYPLTKVTLSAGDEVIFTGKNGKYLASDRVPWQPLEFKKIESFFKPLEKKVDIDYTLDILKIQVLKHQMDLDDTICPTEFNVDKEYIEDNNISTGYKIIVSDTYLAGTFEFDYNKVGNTIRYRLVNKLKEYKWNYYG